MSCNSYFEFVTQFNLYLCVNTFHSLLYAYIYKIDTVLGEITYTHGCTRNKHVEFKIEEKYP